MQDRAEDAAHGFQTAKVLSTAESLHDEPSVGCCLSVGLDSPIRLRLDDFLEPVAPKAKQFWNLRSLVEQVQASWPMDFLAQDLHTVAHVLPDLSCELRAFFSDCDLWCGESVKTVHLFTDGSASQWTLSAWSMVVLYECEGPDLTHSSRFLFRGFAGSILHDMHSWVNHGLSVGEEDHDALSSELTGLVWALGWALQEEQCASFVFHYDNLSAGQGVFGLWNPPKSSKYAQLVRSGTSLRQMLDCKARSTGQHVSAHTGVPWNELADAIAKALTKKILISSALPSSLPSLLHHALLEHAWTEIDVHRALDLRSSVEWPALFKFEGPSNPLSADPFWTAPLQPTQTQATKKPLTVNLRIGTANVLTLDCGAQMQQKSGTLLLGRIGFLQKQFHPIGLHILGLQETRSSGQNTRHSGDWWVFQSGCTDQGTHGIELWFSKTNPYGSKGSRDLVFQSHHFTVLAFHARFLLMEVSAPALQVHVLCLHCPFAQSAAMDPPAFWELLEATLNRRNNQHWPLLVMGDFNAKIGSIQSAAVSSHQAEGETPVGTMMHQFMLGHALCAPCTFAGCHKTAGPTWKVGSPAQSRLDYIVVPQSWLSSVEASEVHYDVDLLTEDDHHLVSLSLQVSLRDTCPRFAKQPRPCFNKLGDKQIVHEFLTAVANLDFVPWTFGVGLHCEILTSRLQELCSRFFSSSHRRPLQRHLSDTTWNLVTIRHLLLRTIRRLDFLQQKLVRWTCLISWRQRYAELSHVRALSASTPITALQALRSSAFLLKLDLIALRTQLKGPARKSSRQDRLSELKSIAVRFVNSASLSSPKEAHRHLKPLLGPHGRKAVLAARPVPAIRMANGELAQSREELAQTWQAHFAAIEGGTPATPSQLSAAVCAFSHAAFPGDQSPALDLQALPTLTQIEAVIRRSRAHKAPGPDQLPAAVYKLDPVLFARLLYPLYLKIGIRCHEPVRFRGGEIMALAKKAHTQFQCADFRAIVLADQLGKYHHTIQRQKLLQSFAEFKAPMQAGCSKGVGVDHVHLQLEAYSDWALHTKRSFCVLFVDVASAYYKAVRPFIVNGTLTDEQIAHIFLSNGWQPDLLHEFLAALQAPSAFVQAGVSDHLHCQVRSCLQATWFSLRHLPETLTSTSQGTRPGNPLADLLYAFLFSRVNHKIIEQMDLAGLLDRFPLRWMPGIPLSLEEQMMCTPGIGSWADDLYLATTTATAKDLRPVAQALCSIALDVSASFGLFLNLGKDKTNLLMVPRGSGSFDFKRSIAAESNPALEISTRSLSTVSVQIVRDYIHLGSLFDGVSNKPEIHRRVVLAMPLAKHLRRPVFGNPSLSLPLRGMLLQSYVLSRFLFGCATWHFHSKQDYQVWFSSLSRLFSVLLPPQSKGPGFTSLDLLAVTNQLHPALLLAKHRLALLSRMFEPHLTSLWSILQAAPTWSNQVMADLHTVQQWVPEFPSWDLSSDLDLALAPFVSSPQTLCSLVRLAEARFKGYLTLWTDFQRFRLDFRQILEVEGVGLAQPVEDEIQPFTHQCSLCSQHFATFHGLASHLHKWHGVKNLARRFVSSNTCRSCLTTYDNRECVIQHLKHMQTGCLIDLVQTVHPLTFDEVQEVDKAFALERKEYKKQLRHKRFRFPPERCHGPLRPPLWRMVNTSSLSSGLDLAPPDLSSWVHDVLSALQPDDPSVLLSALSAQPCTAVSLRCLLAFLGDHFRTLAPEIRIGLALCLDSALESWISSAEPVSLDGSSVLSWRSCVGHVDWQLLADIRIPQTVGPVGPRKPATEWLQALSAPYDIIRRMQAQQSVDLSTTVRWPFNAAALQRQTSVFVYIFSGRRRPGDFMSYAQTLGEAFGLNVQILLVDLALSDQHNMLDKSKCEWLCDMLRRREICAVLVAPPCETWSKARGRPIAGQSDGPRVLRDAASPWGKAGLRRPELQQLATANALMFVTLKICLLCLLKGIMFVMEHPAAPSELALATVWRTWPLKWMLSHQAAQLGRIYQSDYQSKYRKPTDLLAIWLPSFWADMQTFVDPTPAEALRQLEGRDKDGFTTRWAKEYPPLLNCNLAFCFIAEAQRRMTSQAPLHDISPELCRFIESLNEVQKPVELQELQPDFARSRIDDT